MNLPRFSQTYKFCYYSCDTPSLTLVLSTTVTTYWSIHYKISSFIPLNKLIPLLQIFIDWSILFVLSYPKYNRTRVLLFNYSENWIIISIFGIAINTNNWSLQSCYSKPIQVNTMQGDTDHPCVMYSDRTPQFSRSPKPTAPPIFCPQRIIFNAVKSPIMSLLRRLKSFLENWRMYRYVVWYITWKAFVPSPVW